MEAKTWQVRVVIEPPASLVNFPVQMPPSLLVSAGIAALK